MKPTLYGYITIREDMTAGELQQKRADLHAFIEREGYLLAHVFEESKDSTSALSVVVNIALESGVAGVIVACPTDLGKIPWVQELALRRIAEESGVKVLIADAGS